MDAEPAGPVVLLGVAVGLPFALPVIPVVLEPPPALEFGAMAPPVVPDVVLFMLPDVVAPGVVVF